MTGERTDPVQQTSEAGAASPERYSTGLIAFHWITALLVITLLATGWWMLELIHDPARMKSAFPIFKFHKSLGMLVFALSLWRIDARMRSKVPGLPSSMPSWERSAATIVQAVFYVLLMAIPLTGWLYISTEWAESLDKEFRAPTEFFQLFTVPYASIISEADASVRRSLSFRLSGVHGWLAYGLLVMVVLHAAAALKHHLFNKDNVLAHMIPGLSHRAGSDEASSNSSAGLRARRIWLSALGIVLLVAITGWVLNSPPAA